MSGLLGWYTSSNYRYYMYLCCLSLPKAFSVLQFLFSVFYIPEIQMKKWKGYDLYIVDRKKRRQTPPFQLAIFILLNNQFKSRHPAWEIHLYLHELSEWKYRYLSTFWQSIKLSVLFFFLLFLTFYCFLRQKLFFFLWNVVPSFFKNFP